MPTLLQAHSEPPHVHDCIEQAKVLLDAFELTAEERVALYPVIVTALLDKPIGLTPDMPAGLDLSGFRVGRSTSVS